MNRTIDARESAYHGFLSYRRTDRDFAGRLEHALERFAKPIFRPSSMRIFRDESDLEANPDLWPGLLEKLDDSRALILVASPASAASGSVEREVLHALGARPEDSKVLVVLYRGVTPWTDDGEAETLLASRDAAVSRAVYERFAAMNAQPAVVDLRGLDRLSVFDTGARLRRTHLHAAIAAKLLGRRKDQVFDEHVRRQRRVVVAATSVLIALILAISLAIQQTQRLRVARVLRGIEEGEKMRAEARELRERATGAAERGDRGHAFVRIAQAHARSKEVVPIEEVFAASLDATRQRWSTAAPFDGLQLDASMTGRNRVVVDGATGRLWAPAGAGLVMFDLVTGARLAEWRAPPGSGDIEGIETSPDSRWLVTLDDRGTVLRWPVNGDEPTEIAKPDDCVREFLVANSGAVLLVTGAPALVLYEADGTVRWQVAWESPELAVEMAFDWNEAGERIFCLDAQSRLRSWHAADGKLLGDESLVSWLEEQYAEENDGRPEDDEASILGTFVRADLNRAGVIAMVDEEDFDGNPRPTFELRLWRLTDGRPLPPELGDFGTIGWSADGRALVGAGLEGMVVVRFDPEAADDELESQDVSYLLADNLGWDFGAPVAVSFVDPRLVSVVLVDANGVADVDLVDLESEQSIRGLAAHRGIPTAVAISPVRDRVACADTTGRVLLWSTRDGAFLSELAIAGRGDPVGLAWNATGTRLVVAFESGGPLVEWDPQSGSHNWVGERIPGAIEAFVGDPFGTSIALALDTGTDDSRDHPIGILDRETWTASRPLRGHTDRVHALAFDPTGRWLASAASDSTVRIWDIAAGTSAHAAAVPEGPVSLAFAGADRLLVGLASGAVRVLDVATGLSVEDRSLHEESVVALASAPGTGAIVSGSVSEGGGGSLRLSGGPREVTTLHPRGVAAMDLDPAGRFAVVATRDRRLRLFELAAVRARHVASLPAEVSAVLAVDRGRRHLLGGIGMRTKDFALLPPERPRLFDLDGGPPWSLPENPLLAGAGPIVWASFSGDGSRLLVTTPIDDDGVQRSIHEVFDVADRRLLLPGFSVDGIRRTVLSPDGRHVIEISDEELRLRSAEDGSVVRSRPHPEFGRRWFSLSSDYRFMLAESAAGDVEVIDLEDGRGNVVVAAGPRRIDEAGFSPGDAWVVVSYDGGGAQVMATDGSGEPREIDWIDDLRDVLGGSGDGTVVVAQSAGDAIDVRRFPGGERLARVGTGLAKVERAVVADSGDEIDVYGRDGTDESPILVRRFDLGSLRRRFARFGQLPPDDLIAFAHAATGLVRVGAALVARPEETRAVPRWHDGVDDARRGLATPAVGRDPLPDGVRDLLDLEASDFAAILGPDWGPQRAARLPGPTPDDAVVTGLRHRLRAAFEAKRWVDVGREAQRLLERRPDDVEGWIRLAESAEALRQSAPNLNAALPHRDQALAASERSVAAADAAIALRTYETSTWWDAALDVRARILALNKHRVEELKIRRRHVVEGRVVSAQTHLEYGLSLSRAHRSAEAREQAAVALELPADPNTHRICEELARRSDLALEAAESASRLPATVVLDVPSGSPGAEAGLRHGDIVLAMSGEESDDPVELTAIWNEARSRSSHQPQHEFAMKIERAGVSQTVTVRGTTEGIVLDLLAGPATFVVGVSQLGPVATFEREGIRARDLLLAVDERAVESLDALSRILEENAEAETLRVRIRRYGRTPRGGRRLERGDDGAPLRDAAGQVRWESEDLDLVVKRSTVSGIHWAEFLDLAPVVR